MYLPRNARLKVSNCQNLQDERQCDSSKEFQALTIKPILFTHARDSIIINYSSDSAIYKYILVFAKVNKVLSQAKKKLSALDRR